MPHLCLSRVICRLAELLQSKQTDVARENAASLNALVAGGGKKKSKVRACVTPGTSPGALHACMRVCPMLTRSPPGPD
jgi:hypothetical protein